MRRWATIAALTVVLAGHVAWSLPGWKWQLDRSVTRPATDRARTPFEHARRALPILAQSIPADARVLVLTSTFERVQHQFYLLPRSVTLLRHAPQALVDQVTTADPIYGWYGNWLRQSLADRGQLWSETAYEKAVTETDYVITFYFTPKVPESPRLQRLWTERQATVYRVVR